MKKLLLIFLVLFVSLNYAGCGSSSETPVEDPTEVVEPDNNGQGQHGPKDPKDVKDEKDPKGKEDKEDDGI
jgi:hypothetical protein